MAAKIPKVKIDASPEPIKSPPDVVPGTWANEFVLFVTRVAIAINAFIDLSSMQRKCPSNKQNVRLVALSS
ncbi:hypothetical protein ICHIJ1_17900 [Fluviibacter phosphoraccumulans]|nr:hypothetical protein ICHIJ1_17900 [Fluviibacter phosphoraccumulans]